MSLASLSDRRSLKSCANCFDTWLPRDRIDNMPEADEIDANQDELDQLDQTRTENGQPSHALDWQQARAALKAISPPSGRRKRRHYSEEDVHLRFSSCGRCSLFLTTYRLEHNQEFLEALDEIDADWLILPWHPGMRELVNKSFGAPVDVQSYYLEGTCPECYRSFSFAEPDPDHPAWFLIKL